MKYREIASSAGLGKRLVEAGLLPANTRRFLIDCPPPNEGPVKIYYDCYGDVDLISVVFDELIKGAKDANRADTVAKVTLK